MAEEDFTEEDFEDLPPTPGPQRVVRSSAPARKPAAPAPQQPLPAAPPATRDVATPKEKYGVYSIPPRMGIFDNELQRPIIEEGELNSVILSLLVKIANDVDEIKGRL